MQHRPCPHKKQTLEHGMVQSMVKPRNQCQCRQRGQIKRLEYHGETYADKDNTNVLNRVVGKEPFQIVLHQCIKNTHYSRNKTKDKNNSPPPPREHPDKVKGDTDDAVY